LRILWFNWRDLKHPDAGGAEIYTQQIITRLVKRGHQVALFTSQVRGQPENERIGRDIDIIRRGGKFSLYREAKQFCKSRQSEYDLIIDEINARPFINPAISKGKPLLALFHQLIREEWFYETRFPINYICYYLLENRWLSTHRNTPTITVSNSSMQDLRQLGFTKVYVVHNGLSVSPLTKLKVKEVRPTLVFIGRLKKHKLPDHALKAFFLVKERISDAQMWIIGEGDMKTRLESNNPKNVTFFGRVPDKQKFDLVSRAHLMLMPSVREGWGLVVTESNAMGTPVVGYNVSGLKDSIVHLQTGILSEANTPATLASHAIALLRDKTTLHKYSEAALYHSHQFSWDKSADKFGQIIENIVASSPVNLAAKPHQQ
jgi:glycosyltransferase involved in cell wall biosynthesis